MGVSAQEETNTEQTLLNKRVHKHSPQYMERTQDWFGKNP